MYAGGAMFTQRNELLLQQWSQQVLLASNQQRREEKRVIHTPLFFLDVLNQWELRMKQIRCVVN
jgi:hypothetical protein